MTDCRAPVWEPHADNQGGDCRAPATAAVPLGNTNRLLYVCAGHADWYEQVVALPGDD